MVKACTVALAALLTISASAQDWRAPYEQGLKAARVGNWTAARTAFQQAAKARPADQSEPTTLPGPPTQRRQWRDGKPYSPNFLAAYAGYRLAQTQSDDAARNALLKTSAGELEGLIEQRQPSVEAFYYLERIYTLLGDAEKKTELQKKFSAVPQPLTFRVDSEVLPPEDVAEMHANYPGRPQRAANMLIPAAELGNGAASVAPPGAVSVVPTKFALVIGNDSADVPFAAHDAERIGSVLVTSAGYAQEQVVVLQNASAEQIRASAAELAAKVGEGGTVLIYYTGDATHEAGRDFVGSGEHRMPKLDLFQPFVGKGARIFSFFQVHRPLAGETAFGDEVSQIGAISQMQATLAGQRIEQTIRDGKPTGVFTDSFAQVLNEMRSNRIPVLDFAWQVFYKIRRGETGSTVGGGRQTPTLPVLSNLAADARF